MPNLVEHEGASWKGRGIGRVLAFGDEQMTAFNHRARVASQRRHPARDGFFGDVGTAGRYSTPVLKRYTE
jgi:hypothetical protein